MTFDDVQKSLTGIPYLGDAQAWELYRFVQHRKPASCLELGHAHGASSTYIAAALDEFGGHLDTVDLVNAAERTPNLESLLARTKLGHLVTMHREVNSYTWFLKKKIASQTENGKCEPCYDFCFIDGAKNWTIDGLAFFLVDKLLKINGWILFDDYNFTYEKYHRRKEAMDGITIRQLGPDERSEAHVEQIYQLLVRQHPNYSNFILQSKCWAWAQKAADGRRDLVTDRIIGDGI